MNKKSFFVLFLLFILIICFCGCGSDSTTLTTPDTGNSGNIIFASLNSSSDKVIFAMQEAGVIIENTASPDETRHSGVVVDCNIMSSEQILSDVNIQKFLYSGVVFIDPLGEHKQAIRSLIGFAGDINSASDAFFVKAVPGREGNEFIIYDYPGAAVLNSDSFHVMAQDTDPNTEEMDPNYIPVDFDQSLFEESQEKFINTIDGELQDIFSDSVVASYSDTGTTRSSDAPPAQAKYMTWTYTKLSTFYTDAAWAKVYNPTFGSDKMEEVYPKSSYGSQTFKYGHTIVVSLLLNNDPHSQTEAFQYLTVDYTGQLNPQYGKTGDLPMDDYNGDSESGGGHWSSTSLKAWQWVQTGYSFDFTLSGSNAGELSLVDSSPQNVNSVTSYTSGYRVSVGFNAGATPSGPSAGVSGNYTWINTHTTSISDWGCDFTNTSNKYSWTWKTQKPQYTTSYDPHFGGFNHLCYNLFDPTATLVLKTDYPSKNTVDLKIEDTLLQAAAQFEHNTAFHYYGLTVYFEDPGYISNDISVDLGAVFYPDISGFDIAPATVNAGQTATGTITLDNPATKDTVINISSLNTDWATVPDTVTVPSGQQQIDFQITTKDVTGSPTSEIQVSYRNITAEASFVINGSTSR